MARIFEGNAFLGRLWVNGDPGGALSVYIYQVGHSLNWWYASDNGYPYSINSKEWARAVALDSCVVESTARWSFAEALAQCAVMVAYNLNAASINNFNVSCMSNQLSLCKERLGGALKYNPNDKCDPAKRSTNSYVVIPS